MRVFLSSTAQDLVDYRRIADDTILRLTHRSDVMERFGPLPGAPVEECERRARESDVVICIVAHRYGNVPEDGRGSITQREVEAATAAGKDVLVWIVADKYPWTEIREQDLLTDPIVMADPKRVESVIAGVAALSAFKSWLRKTFVWDTFTTPDDLGRRLAVALQNYATKQRPTAPSTPKQAEIRIVHAFQPAPHFQGRDALVAELTTWITDPASPDRVWSLVAAGGTGKTAVLERVVRNLQSGKGNVLGWSFYERPDADAFLRECNEFFLGKDEGPAGGLLERLERGLRDGRPHLLVLDGLERVQRDSGDGHVRGELSDQTLRLLLRALAAGLGHARALVTSRFPLIDLLDWDSRGYRDTRLDDLTPEAATAVLRSWGVTGNDAALHAASLQVGNHALSVAVIGSYLQSFANGSIDQVTDFDLGAVVGDDPRAAKLARVLASYAERMPPEERELLTRVSIFPRGVTLELLSILVDAGGEVAGLLANSKPRLIVLLNRLKARGLVFEYHTKPGIAWTTHPFLRDRFRELLGCPAENVFDTVASALGSGLDRQPTRLPNDPTMLERYERLIDSTLLAGRNLEAYMLYWNALGHYDHLGAELGEYQRGYRILKAFSATGRPEDLGTGLDLEARSILANELMLFAHSIGDLTEAAAMGHLSYEWLQCSGTASGRRLSVVAQNASHVAFSLGHFDECSRLVDMAMAQGDAELVDLDQKASALASGGNLAHALGEIPVARARFASAMKAAGRQLVGRSGAFYGRHMVDLGDLANARSLCDNGLKHAYKHKWNAFRWYHLLLARIALAQGLDPRRHLDEVRAWTARTGAPDAIIETHLLASRHFLATGDPQAALAEVETGMLLAGSCGHGLLRLELLVTVARVWLEWPNAGRAIQAAAEALKLAAGPNCHYPWGEADAAQVEGEAHFANLEPGRAKRAFDRALKVRSRIEHPNANDTKAWLTRVR